MVEIPGDSQPHAIEDFRDQGFVRVRGLLTADEVAHYRRVAVDAIDQGIGKKAGIGGGRTKLLSTKDALRTNAELRSLACHPRLGVTAERLAGLPLRVWGGDAFVKHPGDDDPTIWHDDLTFVPLDSRMTMNAWVALVDVPAERGALTFIPRSHQRPDPYRGDIALAKEIPYSYLFSQWPELEWGARTTVPVRAGDVTFHQSRVAHTAAGNTTDDARVAFIVTFTDAEATYHPLGAHDPAGLPLGASLPDNLYPQVAEFT